VKSLSPARKEWEEEEAVGRDCLTIK